MAKRVVIDWEAIEREYRAGQLSVREVARRYGTAASSIVTRAKRHGWERDLSAAVRARVKAKLAAVNANANKRNANAEEIVEAAATRGAQVVEIHRRDVASLRSLVAKLRDEVDAGKKLYITQYQGEIVEKEVSLTAAEKAAAAANLAAAEHKLIALERQAYSLDDDGPAKAFESLIGNLDPASRKRLAEAMQDE